MLRESVDCVGAFDRDKSEGVFLNRVFLVNKRKTAITNPKEIISQGSKEAIILRQSWEESLLIVASTVLPCADLLESFVVIGEKLLNSNVNVRQRKSLGKSVGGISEHFKMEMKFGTKKYLFY